MGRQKSRKTTQDTDVRAKRFKSSKNSIEEVGVLGKNDKIILIVINR